MPQNHEAIQFLSLAYDDAYVCHTLLKDPHAPPESLDSMLSRQLKNP